MTGRLVGNYQVYEKLGQGGMGTVYRAVDVMLDREVAIKVLRPELAAQPEIAERFRVEAITLARLHHQNIATLYSLSREEGELMMVMEYVRGETMERLLAHLGRIAPGTAVAWCCQVLDAMQYAHRKGIVHRDIKPANLMVTEDNIVKITDFGIARVLGEQRMTRTGHIIGTVAYMAPEQIRGRDADARTDLYALGVVLFELLTGRAPFLAEEEFALMMAQVNQPPPLARAFVPQLPEWLDGAIQRALAKDPAGRFQSATEFHAALRTGEARGPLETEARVTGMLATQIAAPREVTERAPAPLPPTRVAPAPVPPTRLGTPVFSQPPPSAPPATPPDRTRPASPWSQLNWRHYTAAASVGVIAVALVAVWLALRSPSTPATHALAQPASPPVVVGTATGPEVSASSTSEPPRRDAAAAPPPAAIDLTVVPPRSPRATEPPAERAPGPSIPSQPGRPKKAPEAPQVRPAEPAPPDAGAEKPVIPAAHADDRAAATELASYGNVNWVVAEGEGTEETEVVLEFRKDAVRIRPTGEEIVGRSLQYAAIVSLAYSERKPSRWKRFVPFFKSNHWLTVTTAGDSVVLHLDNDNYKTVVAEFEARSGLKAQK